MSAAIAQDLKRKTYFLIADVYIFSCLLVSFVTEGCLWVEGQIVSLPDVAGLRCEVLCGQFNCVRKNGKRACLPLYVAFMKIVKVIDLLGGRARICFV